MLSCTTYTSGQRIPAAPIAGGSLSADEIIAVQRDGTASDAARMTNSTRDEPLTQMRWPWAAVKSSPPHGAAWRGGQTWDACTSWSGVFP
jgi:hypothetical protein